MAERAPLKLTWLEQLGAHPTLTDAEVRVLLVLASYTDQYGRNAYPGPTRLARETGRGISTVKRALAVSVTAGVIAQTSQGGAKRREASVYRLEPWWQTLDQSRQRDRSHQRDRSQERDQSRQEDETSAASETGTSPASETPPLHNPCSTPAVVELVSTSVEDVDLPHPPPPPTDARPVRATTPAHRHHFDAIETNPNRCAICFQPPDHAMHEAS